VAEIAAASREQSSGIEQVNKAVMQMDEMTQQNAALVEEATAASQSMADQARDLTKMMERYEVGDSHGAAQPPARAAAPAKAAPVVERRSPDRPFSGKPAAKPVPAQSHEAPVRPKAVANGNDADWREF
jgi:methyl-accepting chemotaxis protein